MNENNFPLSGTLLKTHFILEGQHLIIKEIIVKQ